MSTYSILMYAHLITVIPCVFLGAIAFVLPKNKAHKIIGRIYGYLMMITSIIALFIPANVGPTVLSHFGFIHLFCFLTLYTVPTGVIAIRKGDLKKHKRKMIGLYIGAIGIAGLLSLAPGRHLHNVLFG